MNNEEWCKKNCPYSTDCACDGVCNFVLSLLKKQEAVEPIAKGDDTYECICGAIVGWDELDASGIVQTRFNYCPYCGQAVKWECSNRKERDKK